jgi:hypothetical protein
VHLFDYSSQTEPITPIKDKTYDRIISHLDEFIKSLPDEDKQLLLQNTSKCYLKYQDSMKINTESDFELKTRLLMSILIDQQIQINEFFN